MKQPETWWIEIMRYVREAPGRLYEDQLERMLRERNIHRGSVAIDAFLNERFDGERRMFLKVDPVTRGIYTVPSQRKELDACIYAHTRGTPRPYKYNRFLYQEAPDPCPDTALTMDALLGDETVFAFDRERMELSIDLARLGSAESPAAVRDFDINRVLAAFRGTEEFHFGEIDASGVVFYGDTCLHLKDETGETPLPHFKKGMCFSEATFCGSLDVGNLVFEFDADKSRVSAGYDCNKVDFRNVRFFDGVLFRDIEFYGEAPDMEISFEDARIQRSLDFINVNFGHMAVNFFQTVLGNYIWHVPKDELKSRPAAEHVLGFKNVLMADDSSIDMTDAEMTDTKIVFENVPALPLAKICLAPVRFADAGLSPQEECPNNYLLIKNCEIQKTLYIGNVSALSFYDSCNYGKIVEAADWGDFLVTTLSGKRKHIVSPILKAVYNNQNIDVYRRGKYTEDECRNLLCYTKAKDFVMLAEDFSAQGKYDQQDEAFILYMEFKPYINSVYRKTSREQDPLPKSDGLTRWLYRLLYFVANTVSPPCG